MPTPATPKGPTLSMLPAGGSRRPGPPPLGQRPKERRAREDPPLPALEFAMNQETLWDYIKGRIAAWLPAALRPADWVPLSPEAIQRLQAAAKAPAEAPHPEEGEPEALVQAPEAAAPAAPSSPAPPAQPREPWPWRAGLALALALLAQRLWEPPDRSLGAGLIFYAAALAALGWALWRGDAALPPLPRAPWTFDDLRLNRPGALLPGILLALAAFVLFGGNRFTGLNLTLWLTSLALLGWALGRPSRSPSERWAAWRQRLSRREWTFTLRPWHGALLALVGLALFFRLYRLAGVPAEMFSDHAEKLLDVADVLAGQWRIFFPRNTGREAMQMYLTAFTARYLGLGLSFLALKAGTALMGLFTLPFIYLLGVELADRRVAFWATALAAMAYWPNVITRVALRFTLYPAWVAPTLYFLVRGLRRGERNAFIFAGIALGLGMHGYSPFRMVPLTVLAAVGLYLLHEGRRSGAKRTRAVVGLALVVLFSVVVFLPLLRYMLGHWDTFFYRSMTRLGQAERPYPGPPVRIFFSNLWQAWVMPFWDNGQIWVHSIPHRPALDWISGGLYALGSVLLLVRYLRRRRWEDLFLLLAVPLLMLPSVLSLAFPEENPSLNRTGGAIVPVFLIVGLGLEGMLRPLRTRRRPWGSRLAWAVGAVLLAGAAFLNYDLVFHQYAEEFRRGAWNTSEMGQVVRGFSQSIGSADHAWVVPYPYWVDTRLVAINAGVFPQITDYALSREDLPGTQAIPGPKLFLVKPEDEETLALLQTLYPAGRMKMYLAPVQGKDFVIYLAP